MYRQSWPRWWPSIDSRIEAICHRWRRLVGARWQLSQLYRQMAQWRPAFERWAPRSTPDGASCRRFKRWRDFDTSSGSSWSHLDELCSQHWPPSAIRARSPGSFCKLPVMLFYYHGGIITIVFFSANRCATYLKTVPALNGFCTFRNGPHHTLRRRWVIFASQPKWPSRRCCLTTPTCKTKAVQLSITWPSRR